MIRKLPSMDQSIPSGVVDQASKAIVERADPIIHAFISEERARISRAAIEGLPFVALSIASFLGTSYFVPEKKKSLKAIGYGTSGAALLGGAWWTFSRIGEGRLSSSPEEESPAFVKSTADQIARSFAEQAEPKIKALVDEEKTKLREAAKGALPLGAASAASFIGTAYLVPDSNSTLKAAGYAASAALALISAWTFLNKGA